MVCRKEEFTVTCEFENINKAWKVLFIDRNMNLHDIFVIKKAF